MAMSARGVQPWGAAPETDFWSGFDSMGSPMAGRGSGLAVT
jgi:hypothetical protein